MSTNTPILDGITPNNRREDRDDRTISGRMGESKDIIQENGKLLSESQRQLLRDISQKSFSAASKSNGIWLQDVILCGTPGRANELVNNINANLRGYGRSVCFITAHDSHVHVNHDCAYAGQSCRCYWRKKISQTQSYEFRRRIRRIGGRRRIRELTISDWQRIFLYFTTEGRRTFPPYINGKVSMIFSLCIYYYNILYIYIYCYNNIYILKLSYFQIQHLSSEITTLEKQRLERPRRESNMALAGKEESCVEGDTDELLRLFTTGDSDTCCGGSGDQTSENSVKKKQRQTEDLFSAIQRILFQFPVSPIINIIDHPVYLNSKLKLLRARNCKLQDALDVIKMRFMRWSIKDFYDNIYSKPNCCGVFSAGHIPISDYYYNTEESITILEELLYFQFNSDNELISMFLLDLYNILDRKIPKCNSILVYSPPSAGKNFFFDAFIDYFLNKGQLGKANKYNQFAFQDAAQKRVILWNEPNYESSNTDLLKMILGGDAYNVPVKCKPDIAVYRTPVILLTNNKIPLMCNPAFRDRIKQYTWCEAPYLKGYDKKPYPVAIYHLFVKYKIL